MRKNQNVQKTVKIFINNMNSWFSNFVIDKMHKRCSANICNAHRELTANYNHTSSAKASLVVFVSSGFHAQLKSQIKVCFTYFVHFALLIIKHLFTL